VVSKLQICQLEIPVFIYKFKCQSSLINSDSFGSVDLMVYRHLMKAKLFFSTFIISNSQIEKLVSYSRSTYVNVNMSFPISNFEGIFSSYVFTSHFDIIER